VTMTQPEIQSPLEYSPSHGARYYKPTRTSDPGRLALGTVIALIGAVIVGGLYGWIDVETLSLYGKAFAIAGAAVAVGLVTLIAIKLGRVRTRAAATVLAALVALAALYASWAVWTWLVLQLVAGPRAGFSPLWFVLHPIAHLRLVQQLNAMGLWAYQGTPVTGIPLLIVWLTEALLIVIGAVVVATTVSKDDVDRPFCERCRRWCERQRGLPDLAATDEEGVAVEVEAKDFDALAARGPLLDDDEPHIWLRLFRCPNCGEANVLTVKRVALVVNEQGMAVARSRPIVEGLLLTAAEAEAVLAMKEKVEALRPGEATSVDDEEPERPYDPAEDPG